MLECSINVSFHCPPPLCSVCPLLRFLLSFDHFFTVHFDATPLCAAASLFASKNRPIDPGTQLTRLQSAVLQASSNRYQSWSGSRGIPNLLLTLDVKVSLSAHFVRLHFLGLAKLNSTIMQCLNFNHHYTSSAKFVRFQYSSLLKSHRLTDRFQPYSRLSISSGSRSSMKYQFLHLYIKVVKK